MKSALALAGGVVFGLGLALSGMTNPAKVLGFLDLLGDWDASLAFVMGAAVLVSALGYVVARRMKRPWWGDSFGIPTRRDLDASLIVGASVFGIGWGLVGLCPGPALTGLWRGSQELIVFDLSMLAGIVAMRWIRRRPVRRSS